jgi:putative tricarboxylic transport membrane protein
MRLRFICYAMMGILMTAGVVGLHIPIAASGAGADWKPQKPVEIVVPTAAGGENDRVARRIQIILHDKKKLVTTPFLTVNQAGGNQVMAVIYVTKYAPDPHYILYATGTTMVTNEIAGLTKLSYRDMTPIAKLLCDNTALTVAVDSPLKTMRDLIDRLKADVKSISFGTVSRGGANHLVLARAVRSAGIDPKGLKMVIFKTNAESMTAVMGKHIDVVASSVSAAFNNVQAGNVRMLAVSSPKRLNDPLAGVATMAETGLDVAGVTNCRYICAPKGITAAQKAFWENAMAVVNEDGEWKKDITERNQAQDFQRGKELDSHLDETYKATKDTMMDIGLAKSK